MSPDANTTSLPLGLDFNAIVTFISGVFVTIIGAMAGRSLRQSQVKQNRAEGDATLAEATLKWATQLRDDLDKARAETETRLNQMSHRVSVLERENEAFRRHNGLLIEQVIDAGLVPVPRPLPRTPKADGET